MNTINNTFSLTRLVKVIGIDLRAYSLSRRMYIGVVFIFLATQLGALRECVTFYKTGMIDSAQMFDHFALQQVPIFYGFLFGMMLFSIATAYGLGGKSDAIYYLNLPATNSEKFVSRAMIAVIEPIVMTLLAMLTVDLVRIGIVEYRMAVNPDYVVLTDGFKGLTIPYLLSKISWAFSHWFTIGVEGTWLPSDGYVLLSANPEYVGYAFTAFCVLVLVWMYSLALLVGHMWNRKPTAMFLLLLSALVFVIIRYYPYALRLLSPVLIKMMNNQEYACIGFVVFDILLMCLVIFNWWLSYRLFSRKQVVPVSRVNFFKNRKEAAV